MYRVRNNHKRWRLKWPWRLFLPLKVDERFCRECGMPFHEGPLPEEVNRYRHGNVEGLLYPAGGFGRGAFVVRVGRWKVGGQKFFLSDFIPEEELDSLLRVVNLAREEYRARMRASRARR
jgi:hypothetical protein